MEILRLASLLKEMKKISSKKKTMEKTKRRRRANASFSDSVADSTSTLTKCVSLLTMIIYLIFTLTIVHTHINNTQIQTKLNVLRGFGVLGLVGLIDAKGIDLAQPVWS